MSFERVINPSKAPRELGQGVTSVLRYERDESRARNGRLSPPLRSRRFAGRTPLAFRERNGCVKHVVRNEVLMPSQKKTTLNTSYHEKRLAERKKDATFKAEFDRASRQISQIDAIMQSLEDLRMEAGVSKAELARQIGKDPASVRRLFTAQVRNPELRTVAAIASVLDADIQIVPRGRARRRQRAATA
jgi:DNA-binding XRE family transcriptional regulator